MGMRIAPALNKAAGYGAWLSILAIAVTAYVSNADTVLPFWIIGAFLVLLCLCIAIRVVRSMAGDVGLTK